MLTRSFLILAALTLGGEVAAGQQQSGITVGPDGQMVTTPQMGAKLRKRREVLEDPDSFVFRITLKEERAPRNRRSPRHDAQGARFKVGEDVGFEVWVTNTSAEPFEIIVDDTYQSHRPQLFREGELQPYRKEAVQTLEKRKTVWAGYHRPFKSLEPNHPQFVSLFDLKYWYGPLEPGKYRLLLKHNLDSQKWFELPPVDFEVVP